MAAPNEKLAESLLLLLQREHAAGRRVFRSSEFTRTHRAHLVRSGFLRVVVKGWLISASPGELGGDSTTWYASFWEFCAGYCSSRFGFDWHLAPEQSLLLHAGSSVIPRQVVVHALRGGNHSMALPFDTSLFDLRAAGLQREPDVVELDGLRVLSIAAALAHVPERFYRQHPVEAQLMLASVRDASEILRPLLDQGRTAVAGRLAGGMRHVGRADVAARIVATMRAAHFGVQEVDPFDDASAGASLERGTSPVVARLRALWSRHRTAVLERFPSTPGRPVDRVAYVQSVEDSYASDAYHSLSIEGYVVSADLVERVRSGRWDPLGEVRDRSSRDALAARGYWQAFQVVKRDVAAVIQGSDAGQLVGASHMEWYGQLFEPFVSAAVVAPGDLAGYRAGPVYLRGSRHVPPPADVVRDAMPALLNLIAAEPESAVRAVLGHWMLGYVHPFPDGNGRIARLLMNVMLASGGYPWTVIRVEDRDEYLAALEAASVDDDISPFADFIARNVEAVMAQQLG